MIDVYYASLTSQGVQHRVFYLDGHPSRYQPRPTGLTFGEQTGTGVFPLVRAVPILRSMVTLFTINDSLVPPIQPLLHIPFPPLHTHTRTLNKALV